MKVPPTEYQIEASEVKTDESTRRTPFLLFNCHLGVSSVVCVIRPASQYKRCMQSILATGINADCVWAGVRVTRNMDMSGIYCSQPQSSPDCWSFLRALATGRCITDTSNECDCCSYCCATCCRNIRTINVNARKRLGLNLLHLFFNMF